MKVRLLLAWVPVVLLACEDKKFEQRLKKSVEDTAKAKSEEGKKAAEAKKPAPAVEAPLPAPWNAEGLEKLVVDGPCPEDWWALFPANVPGATPAEKKANAQKRPALEKAVREKTYFLKLRAPSQVVLQPFDAPKGELRYELPGTIECTDSIGHITLAWSKAQATDPAKSATKASADFVERLWKAPPITLLAPAKTMLDAKEFTEKNRLGLTARLVLKLGTVAVDKKLIRVAKVEDKGISIGGGTEDWGAGRLVRADLTGLRVAVDHEKTTLYEKQGHDLGNTP